MPSSGPADASQQRLAGKVIVVLEDDELVRRASERLLRRFGAEVVAGRTSGEVLEALAARGLVASCIVADFWLNGYESGLAAVDRLSSATSGGRFSAVIVTGDLSRETAAAVAAAGFPLLRKPVDTDRFIQALIEIA